MAFLFLAGCDLVTSVGLGAVRFGEDQDWSPVCGRDECSHRMGPFGSDDEIT